MLEGKFVADAEREKATAAERRLKNLEQLLHQTGVLHRTLLADTKVVAAAKGGDTTEEEACWAGTGARGEISTGEARTQGFGEEPATEEELLLKARARYA